MSKQLGPTVLGPRWNKAAQQGRYYIIDLYLPEPNSIVQTHSHMPRRNRHSVIDVNVDANDTRDHHPLGALVAVAMVAGAVSSAVPEALPTYV